MMKMMMMMMGMGTAWMDTLDWLLALLTLWW